MKKFDFMKHWRSFASFWVRLWQRICRWDGWKKCFPLPYPLVLALAASCTAGLVWVFTQGLELSPPAYFLYALSFYTLTALCIQLPRAVRGLRVWLDAHPRIAGLLKNREIKFSLELYFEQFLNFAYGVFKIASGIVIGSAWIGADGIYNFTQAIIQLFQILRRKNPGSIENQWRSYRVCGWLILLMHLTLTGIVFQMVSWRRAEEHGQIMVIATAAFAFYKITTSFIEIVKDRKHIHPIDSSVRMLELSQAIFAIFSLQASLLHTFGTGKPWEDLMNLATGCVVCLMVAAMGVYMIRRGTREIKKQQEKSYGP